MSRRRFLFAAAAVMIGSVLAIAGAELAVRIGGLEDFGLELALAPGTPAALRFDERLGWSSLPGRGENNRQGFRHLRDYTPKKNRAHRIAIVGDSQVFGFYVKKQQHLGVVLDRRLPNVETYSFGVPGYGPTQELLLVGDVLKTYETDALVVVPFLENDLIDATQEMAYGHLQKPYFEESATGWRVANVPVPRPLLTSLFYDSSRDALFLVPRPALYRASALYRAVANRSTQMPRLASFLSAIGFVELSEKQATVWGRNWSARRVDGQELECWLLTQCPEDHWLDGLPAMLAAYVEMARQCDESGVAFAVLLAPSLAELERGRFPVATALAAGLRERGIEVIDLVPTFSGQGHWSQFTRPAPDTHWSPLGHQVAVNALAAHWRRLRSAAP